MLSDALVYLKNSLNVDLAMGSPSSVPLEDLVVFINGSKMDPLTFTVNRVSMLLINIEQENILRRPDPYLQINPDGTRQKVNPAIHLNLYVLFVANATEYEDALRLLSRVIRYFQTHRLIERQNAPDLPSEIEKLVIELRTLPFAEQNEVWSSLRVTYHPSVLYKVGMIVFSDLEPKSSRDVVEIEIDLS